MKRLKMLIVILMLIFLLIFSITAKIYEKNFDYRGNVTAEEIDEILGKYPELTREKEEIMTKRNVKLSGYWYNKEAGRPIIVFSQGIRTKAIGYIEEIKYFATNGYTVFSFDNTGCGESGGENIRGLPQSVVDLDCVLSFLEKKYGDEKIFLYGHSWGGYAVCAVNNFKHDVSGIVERSGFNSTSKMIHRAVTEKQNEIVANVISPFVSVYEFIKFGKYSGLTAVDGINSVECPVLLLHSYDDTVVPYDVGIASRGEEIINQNVEFKVYNDRNHHVTSKDGSCDYEALKEIKEFFDKIVEKKGK